MSLESEIARADSGAGWPALENLFTNAFLSGDTNTVNRIVGTQTFRQQDLLRVYQNLLYQLANRYSQADNKTKAALLDKILELVRSGVNLNNPSFPGGTFLNQAVMSVPDPLFLGVLLRAGADPRLLQDRARFNQIMASFGYQV
jgi:hypothetical protein